MTERPALFIGSSVEGLDIAHTVQELLEFDFESTVWNQGVFKPSQMTLADLYVRTRRTDLALFVFTPDDVVTIRGETVATPRDNVIFELGLFLGALEPDRCFILQPRGASMHLPTDLLGLSPLTYDGGRNDRNLLAALGPACNQMRRAAKRFQESKGVLKFSVDKRNSLHTVEATPVTLDDYIDGWNGALSETYQRLAIPLDAYDEETPAARAVLRRVFGFLDNLSDAILSGDLDEAASKRAFREVILRAWPSLAINLAPPNHVDDFWRPQPRLSELYVRWLDNE